MENKPQDYVFEHISGSLIFKTENFRPEKGSVLHSGVYNREMASTFVAAGTAFSYFVFAAFSGRLNVVHYAIVAVLFTVLYPLSWLFIFRRSSLAVFLDNGSGVAAISVKGAFRKKTIMTTLNKLRDITVLHKQTECGNPDGVAFVEKIALQHGTVIPGFGATHNVYSVELVFEDGPVTVYSSSDEDVAASVLLGFKNYIVRD
ncbi:MAG: hypothetical protein L7F77_06395 [Candidatus Magnetominusculus sp. LBB02]|nr:hypothetical protein [Candidatus Magnetominusculus sp. LBB02]